MKSFLIILIYLFFLIGCSDKNAFTKFNMTTAQELTASSLQSSKIKLADKVDGIVSVVYLNEVYPHRYFTNEYFFVYLYLKNKKELYNPVSLEDVDLVLKLNDKLPIKIKKLPYANEFSNLINTKSKWNRYYLVAFKKEKSNKLSIVLENGQSSSDPLVYQKGEQ